MYYNMKRIGDKLLQFGICKSKSPNIKTLQKINANHIKYLYAMATSVYFFTKYIINYTTNNIKIFITLIRNRSTPNHK